MNSGYVLDRYTCKNYRLLTYDGPALSHKQKIVYRVTEKN